MAIITLNIPAAAATRFVKAIGYSATLPDGSANPVTATQAAKDWIVNDMKAAIKAFEAPGLSATAVSNNSTDIDTNISIT